MEPNQALLLGLISGIFMKELDGDEYGPFKHEVLALDGELTNQIKITRDSGDYILTLDPMESEWGYYGCADCRLVFCANMKIEDAACPQCGSLTVQTL